MQADAVNYLAGLWEIDLARQLTWSKIVVVAHKHLEDRTRLEQYLIAGSSSLVPFLFSEWMR
jgi:hypothetical protein